MNKVAIVTGSSQGIGKEVGSQLLELGTKVVFVARSKSKLNILKKEFGTDNALYLSLDLSVEKNCAKLISSTIKKFGKIDILINNVGRGFRGQFADTDIETFESVLKVNLMSAVYCSKYAIPEIEKSKGSIIFISSMSGIRGVPCYGAYSVSKGALNRFSEILDIELGRRGVHVGLMVFGPVETEKNKTYIGAKGTDKFLKEPRSMISIANAASKIVKCIRKRKHIMYITRLSKSMFYLNRLSPGIVRFFMKHFRCPQDFN